MNMDIGSIKIRMLINEAEKWIGVTETNGENSGSNIEIFQKAVDGIAMREAWCLAFIQFCIQQVDAEFEKINGGPNPPSWLFKTEHCLTLWNKSPFGSRVKNNLIYPGCLVVWQFYKNNSPTAQGHVGIITKVINSTTIETIEANTSDSSKEIIRDGDGVFRKTRNITQKNGSMRIKGFLTPWEAGLTNTVTHRDLAQNS